jgi:hypothetical protein
MHHQDRSCSSSSLDGRDIIDGTNSMFNGLDVGSSPASPYWRITSNWHSVLWFFSKTLGVIWNQQKLVPTQNHVVFDSIVRTMINWHIKCWPLPGQHGNACPTWFKASSEISYWSWKACRCEKCVQSCLKLHVIVVPNRMTWDDLIKSTATTQWTVLIYMYCLVIVDEICLGLSTLFDVRCVPWLPLTDGILAKVPTIFAPLPELKAKNQICGDRQRRRRKVHAQNMAAWLGIISATQEYQRCSYVLIYDID